MSAVGDALAALAKVFGERRVGWYLFGAQAVAVRGAPRATQDVDVTVQVDPAGRGALRSSLEAAGFAHRYPDQAADLLARGAVLPLVHASGIEVDVVIAGSGLESMALARATRVPVDGVEVPVAQATDLVVMKVLAGRGKDLDDVRALLAGGEVDPGEARDLLRQLDEALGRSDLVSALDAALSDVS